MECAVCNGTGGRYAFGRFMDRYGDSLLEGRHAFLDGFVRHPLDGIINCLVVLMTGLLMRLAAIVDCPYCGGGGRVSIAVDLPDSGTRETEQFCGGCGGSGQGTVLDRWVIRLQS